MVNNRELNRIRRCRRIRKKVSGASQCPRLAVFRSLKHIYAQVIDDMKGRTLLSASSLDKEFKERCHSGGNIKAASLLGEILSQKAKSLGITKIVFDKNGYLYHGRIKAFAEAARKGGLLF